MAVGVALLQSILHVLTQTQLFFQELFSGCRRYVAVSTDRVRRFRVGNLKYLHIIYIYCYIYLYILTLILKK